jgi:hypothetical protein
MEKSAIRPVLRSKLATMLVSARAPLRPTPASEPVNKIVSLWSSPALTLTGGAVVVVLWGTVLVEAPVPVAVVVVTSELLVVVSSTNTVVSTSYDLYTY